MSILGNCILIILVSVLLNVIYERVKKLRLDQDTVEQELKEKMMNRDLFVQTAEALASAIDAKDKYTHGHSVRVAEYARKMAAMEGKTPEECDEVYFAGLLHDVGKIGIPGSIINKEGKLTPEEFEVIKTHPSMGKQILSSIDKLPYLSIGANSHHERYDGQGYPEFMKGTDIPELARIIAVADAYDAMSSKRSYRDPLPQQKIREEIVKGMGTQFDPVYAKHMLHLIDLDSEYEMKEKEEVKQISGRAEIVSTDDKKAYSEGIPITPYKVRIHLKSRWNDQDNGIPTLLLFDSLDGRIHFSERDQKNMNYSHYCDIRPDGVFTEGEIREKKILWTGDPGPADKLSMDLYIEAVKWMDHIYITMFDGYVTTNVTIALPDSTRYAYLAFTGEKCVLTIENIERDAEQICGDDCERLVEELCYIEGPEGDVPSIQVNGWREISTQSIPIKNRLTVSFHMKSLPSARLVWHLPFLLIFSAKDRQIRGIDYREFALIRLDGEAWQEDPNATNRLNLNRTVNFAGWDEWKAENKLGRDCTVTITREGNKVVTETACGGLEMNNLTVIEGEIPELNFAFTGDQCVIENIRILESI